jgi:DNA replication and repair protein RecF
LKQHLGVRPVLLLDDIFDKLDQDRVRRLLQLVSDDYFGQVLVTDTDVDRLETIFRDSAIDLRLFSVNEGRIELLGEGVTEKEPIKTIAS